MRKKRSTFVEKGKDLKTNIPVSQPPVPLSPALRYGSIGSRHEGWGIDLKKLIEEYSKQNLKTKQLNYINPLMNAVSSLSKEDLAEMAESLIYLTYLKRRITFAEESVGGAS